MKNSRFLLSTLFAAAALSVAPAVPALADGDGSANSPYSGDLGNFAGFFDSTAFPVSSTIYIDGITGTSLGSAGSTNYTCVADLNIGSKGMAFTNGYSSDSYTFSGNIYGTGGWSFSNTGTATQDLIFTGSLAGYSGNISITSGSTTDYIHFGNGEKAAADTNVSGTGSISITNSGGNGELVFNYSGYAGENSQAITIGNSSLTAGSITFTGSVNYTVSSVISGNNSNSTLTISNTGYTTTLSGDVSIANITVSSSSTLALNGTVDLSSAITNSGTVSLNESVIFVLDNMSFTGKWEEGATYTLITGGTIQLDGTTLESGTIYSLDTSNLYTADGTISSATFSYDSGSLTVTVTGEHPDNGLNGDGSAEYPYFTYGSSAVSIPVSIFTGAGTKVYLATDEQSLGTASMQIYWSGAFTAECDIVIGAAGVYITDGSAGQSHTFSGAISGTGDFTVTHNGSQGQSVNQDYTFTGDLSGWSGNFTIDTTSSSDYVHYGEETVAATGTNVTGTGAISVSTGTVQFNYVKTDGTTTGPSTITIGNSSITANNIIFAGDVTYVVDLTKTTIAPNNLTVEEDATLKIAGDGEILIDSPNYVVDIEGTLEVGEGVAFTLHKRTHTATSVTNLVLDNGSTFTLYTQGDNPSAISDGMAVGTLTVDGSSKIVTSNWQNYVSIGTLVGEDATLALSSTAASDSATIFELGGSNESSQFTGTITLSEDATGNYRGVTLIISDEKVAAGAVIEMGTEYNTNDSIALGVNASRVEIAGLVSSNSGGDIVYSGYVSLGATFGDGGATLADYKSQSNYGSGSNYDGVGTTTNTLVITVASGESYSFSGVFLDKVNIEKGGEGTQSIAFNVNQWQSANYFDGSIVVTGGTLNLSGVAITSSGISVSSGATLSIANQITLASNSSSTVSGNLTVSGEGSLSVSSGATLDLSGATVSLSSTIANSGTVTVNSSTVFLIDDLTGGADGEYTIISGGTIYGWDDLTDSNFVTDTRATITVGDSGTITYTSGAASLVWNGSTGDVWQLEGDSVWLNGSNNADSFYNDDTVTFDSGTASSTVIVSGTVKPGSITVNSNYTFTVASGDTALIDTSILTISNGATLTIDKGVTIYFDIGTVTAFSISGIAGTGTLEFEFNSDYTSTVNLGSGSAFEGEVYIISGNLQLGTSNIGNGSYRVASGVSLQSSEAVSIPGLIIEGDTTLSKANSSSDDKTDTSVSITSLVIENNSTLTFYTTSNNPNATTKGTQGLLVGTLTVSGDSAIIKTDYWQNYVSIGSIVGTDVTLTLSSNASSSATNIYELGGSNANSLFTGTISISDTNSGNNRSVSLVISDAYVAAGAVVEFGSVASVSGTNTYGSLSLGVNASTVEIAGLKDASEHSYGDIVYSGSIDNTIDIGEKGTNLINYDNETTGYTGVGVSTNTLVINVAEGASYSFTGIFLDKLNIEKKGSGTQTINFEDESYFNGKITVSAGTLSISGSVGASEISVASSANLELTGSITLSSAISNSGIVIVDTSTVFVLDNLNGVETEEGTVYTIISGGTIYGWDDLTDSNFVTDSRATVTVGTGADAGTVTILEGVAADLIWSGSVDNVWDRTTKNWTNNGTQDKFAEHDSVTFTTSGQGTVTVESEGVIANTVTVSSGTYTFVGGYITAESFVIENGATVSLGGSLIYSDFVVSGTLKLDTQIDGGYSGEIYGAITIDNGGRVELNVGDATGWEPGYGVTGITVNSGGTLYVGTDSNQTLGGCTLTLVGGTVTGVENSNIDIYTNSSVIVRATSDATAENPTVSTVTKTTLTPRFGNGSSTTFDIGDNAKLLVESGIVSGAQGSIYNDTLVKTGAGTLEVTGIFALNQGKLDIQEGSVVLEGTVIGTQSWGFSIGFASAVTISAGASLEMNLLEDTVLGYYEYGDTLYDSTFVGSCSITGAGDFIKSGSTSLTVSNYGVTGSTTISEGTLILSGNSTIGGTVTIAGTLEVASGASLTLEGTLGDSDSTGTVTFADGAKLIISDSFLGNSIEITVNDDGTTSVTSGGAITVIEASTIIFGSTTIDDSTELSYLLGSFVQYSEDYTLEWAYSDGVLTATITDANVKTYLLPTAAENDTTSATNNVMAAGYYVIDPRTSKQGWIDPWGSGKASDSDITLSFEEGSFFYGEGLLGIYFKLGSGSTVETTDLTNVDASNLKGQLIVINSWNNETDVKLLGDTWANVEYLFANAVDDETIATKYGLTGITRGDLNNPLGTKTLEDILALQGDTTLAGVTGATKGVTTNGTDNVYITLCDHETITVASNGTTLTIAGSEEYGFYGTVGTNSTRATISMTGSGKQTFGGTNYLQHVYVSNGNLVLGGNTDVASTTTVSGGTLTVGCSYDDKGQSVSFGGSVTVEEGGTLAITGTGYFSGETSVVGGALQIASGSTTIFYGPVSVSSGGTFQTASGSTMAFGGSVSVSSDSTITLGGTTTFDGSLVVSSGGTLEIAGEITLSDVISNSGTVTIDASSATFVVDNLELVEFSEEVSYYKIISNSGSGTIDASGLSISNFTGDKISSRWVVYYDDRGLYIYLSASETLVWAGTEGNNSWTVSSTVTDWKLGSEAKSFTAEDDVKFDNTAENKTVSISEGIIAGYVTVSGEGYEFSISESGSLTATDLLLESGSSLTISGGSVTVTSLEIENNANLALSGSGMLAVSTASISGTLSLGDGTTLDLTGATLSDIDTVGVYGTGTILIVATSSDSISLNDDFAGTLKVSEGTLNVSNLVGGSNTTLEFVAGTWNSSSVTSTTNIQFSSSTPLTNDIVLSGDGAIVVGLESGTNIEISGKVTSGENVTLYRGANNGNGGDVLTFSGEVDLAGGYTSYRGKTKFSGGGSIGTLTLYDHGYTDGVTFSGDGMTYTIGTISFIGSSNSGTVSLDIDSGVTVNADTFSASWGIKTVTVNGTFNVGKISVATGGNSDTFTGSGTITVGELSVGNAGKYTFSSLDLYIGAGGITNTGAKNGYTLTFGDGLTVGVYAGDNENKSWSTSEAIILSGSVTFKTESKESITLSGVLSGSGTLIKEGEGTLTLSGSNTFTGGITLSEGTLEIGNANALGGTLTIGEGTTLTGSSVTLTGASFVVTGDATISGLTIESSTFDWAVGAKVSLDSSATITAGTVNFASETDFTGEAIIIFTDTGLDRSADLSGWTATLAGYEGDVDFSGTFSVDSSGNIVFVASDEYLNNYGSLVWDADLSKDQTWAGNYFQGTEYGTGRNYLFNEKSYNATSTLSGTITTNRVTIDGEAGEITWTTATNSTTISGTDLNINVGATLNFTPSSGATGFALNFTNINLSGALVYAGAGVTWSTVTFGDDNASLALSTTDAVTISNLVASTDGAISSTGGSLVISNASGSGDVTISGSGDGDSVFNVSLGDLDNYSGMLSLEGNTTASLTQSAYNNTNTTISVGEGATLDLNGHGDTMFKLVLAGGTLTSSSSTQNSWKQLGTLVSVTADSYVNTGDGVFFGLIGSGYGRNYLDLGESTLTVTGTGTFYLRNTEISGESGTLQIDGGTVDMNNSTSVKDDSSLSIGVGSDGKLALTTSLVLDTLNSAGSITLASGYSLEIAGEGEMTISGEFVLNSSTLSVTGGAVVDMSCVTTSQNGGSGTLIISGEGSTIKIASGAWGSSSSFGSNMNNCYLQISDGGILEVTAVQASAGAGYRGFAIMSGTGTYRYSGEGTSYVAENDASDSAAQKLHIADGATLVFDVVNEEATLDVSKLIANSYNGEDPTETTGSVKKTGAGTLILSGENLYSGGTTISAGILELQDSSALGSGNVKIEEGGTLVLNDADETFTLPEVSGEGSLVISAGTLATSGSNLLLTGTTTIGESGTLALTLAAGTTTLATTIAVENDGTLTLSSSSAAELSATITVAGDGNFTASITGGTTTLSGAISGSGTLTKTGSGTLVLSENTTITNIAMFEGTLSGFTLSEGMTATITGGALDSFTVATGGTLVSEIDSVVVTGDVTLSGGSISLSNALSDSADAYFNVDVANNASVTITGAITFNLDDIPLTGGGDSATVVIFDSGVTFDNDITKDDLTLNYGGSGSGGDPHFSDDTGFVWDEDSGSLSARIGLKSIDLHWQGSDETDGNILKANEVGNFYQVDGKDASFFTGDTIYFGDASGSDAVVVGEVTLGSDIEAWAIIVEGNTTVTIDTDNGTYALTGEGTLSVASGSSLTLKNANHSYTGGTTVNGSLTLEITEASGSGQLFASVVSGEGSLTIDIAEDLTISIADNLTGTDNQLIAGSISFVKSGSGTLVIDAAQTDFSGSVEITGGTMVIASSGLFGDSTSITIDEDGTLEISDDITLTETLSGAGTLLVDENLTLTTDASKLADFKGTTMLGNGVTLTLSNTSETEVTVGTAITGSNATLIKTGEGTVNLASDTTVKTITVSAGTLGNVALSDGMTLTTEQGTGISSVSMTGGTLTAAKGTTISGITMEGGTLDASNVFEVTTDSITLSGENSFSGGTVLLGEGTLIEDGVQSTPIVAAFILDSGSSVSVSDDIVFNIDKVELPDTVYDENGNRVYTISYQVFDTTSGTLEGWENLEYTNFAIDGVVLSGNERTRVEISSDGSVQFYITEYDLVWNGGESGVWNTSDESWTHNVDDQEYSETYNNGDNVTFTSDYGKLTITLGGDVNPSTLTVDKDADVTIIGGEYKITGSKTKIVIEENGKLTLTSGGNDFGGGVTIGDGGELALKVSSDEAYLVGVEISLAEDASGTFTIDTDANVTYENILSDTTLPDSDGLTLVKDGSGTLTITSELGYKSLDLEVKSGTLKIATEGSVGSVDINLSGSANLELENNDTTTAKEITNSISGVGTATTIIKTGEGEIIIAGDNSGFSGSVEIYEGTLTLKSADALGSVTKTTIAEDGTLKLDIGDDFDLNDIVGTVSGSGTIEINLGDNGTIYASSGYYGSGKFTDFTGSFVIDGGADTTITMEVDVSNTSRGSAIGDANVELGENVDLVFNIQNAGYSYAGSISGAGTVSFKWDSNSSVSHTFSLTGDNSGFSGTIYIPEDIVLTAKGGNALGGKDATVDNSGELWIDEDDTSSVVSKLTGSGNLHKTGSGAVKIYNTNNDLSGDLEIRGGALCFVGTATLGNIAEASVSEGATFELEVDSSDADNNKLNVAISGEGSVVIHGYEGNCIIKTYASDEHFDNDGYSTDTVTLGKNSSSSYNGGLTVDSAYLITSKTSSFDSMNELGTSTITITNNSTWDASNGGFTASGSRTINIEDHSRLLAGAFKAESGDYGSISISNIRIDTNAADAADLYISVTSSSDITRNYITGSGGTIYLDGVDIYLDTTITSFGQITVIDTSNGLKIDGTPNVYINGELESESYWINGVISQDSISEDVKKHGLSYAAMVVMPTEAFIQDVRTIHSRLEQRRFAFSREGEWEFFAQAQTIQEDSGSGSDSKSFDYQTYGAIVGADVRIDQTTIFGMALAYDHGDAKLHHSEGHIKMDDYRFTAFGSKVFANWLFVEGGAQFGIGSYDIRRRAGSTVGDNNGDTDGVNVGGFFTFGGVVPITDNIFLTPYIGLTYMYSHVDSFDETGSYGYKADGFNANSLRGKIGTQLRTELMLGDTPTALALGLSYAHEFIDDDIDYDVAAITYSDKKQSLTENAFTEDLISIGLSAEFGVTDSASVFMGYNADIGLGNSEVSHAVNAGLKVTF